MRTEIIFHEAQERIYKRTDRMFGILMAFQWAAGVTAALIISPRTWIGTESQVHIHVWAALLLGGVISFFPILLVLLRPGKASTRYVIAVAQMLMSALLIHLMGGRIETHFHVFGSLAFLAFYRDWRILVPATLVVALDHFLRGVYFPQSVFGVLSASPWRWVEHAGWVIFEDYFLIYSCRQSVKEMWAIAERTAELETINQTIEATVFERTKELAITNENLKREIIERKQMEEDLWESQARLRQVTDAVPGMVHQYRLSREGKYDFLFVSRGAQELFEISDDKLCVDFGLAWNQVLPEDREMLQEAVRVSTREIGPLIKDFRIKTPSGKNKWVRWISVPEQTKNGEPPVRNGIFLDVTDHIRLQNQMVEFEKSETVARLAAGAAHEVKNPLAILLQGLDYLSGHAQLENSEIPPLLQDMELAIHRADTIIKGLLDLSRPTQLALKPENLNAILESSLLLVKNILDRNHVQVEKNFDALLPSVELDKDKMTQVFINLFTNAVDAMPGGGTLTVKSYARNMQARESKKVVVEIEDTGPGISKDALPKIFEPFFTTKRGRGGTGLGLPVVRNIIQFHHGMIEIKNREERGARALLTFPIATKTNGTVK